MVRYRFCWYSHSYPRKKKPGARRAKKRKDFLAFLESLGCHSRKSLESQEWSFHGKPRICLKSKKSHEKPGLLKIFLSLKERLEWLTAVLPRIAKKARNDIYWNLNSLLFKEGSKHTQPHKKCSNISIYLWDPPLIHVLAHSEMFINWT